ncbi:heterokaryon incompatibility protein-domain-containing protein [Phaeosphaeria sp. MPI-PUGE-AT-0046c]|nr:heterokaryon incompatibility protein-domain-containing protein [Phaeosphaeria sp. MPI-PUGE-AT-0046c]
MPSFAYTPLPPGTIRLLSPASRGTSSGHIWRLETVKLNEGVKYDALSYTWGSQDEKLTITLNGRCFHVHRNLYTALPYLATRRRRRFQRHPIWIDAICINQEDKEEVRQQVALMNYIFGQARMVWVWLGLTEVQSWIPEAIMVLDKIASAAPKIEKTESKLDRLAIIQDMDLYGLQPALLDAIAHLIGNPWYYRVWVIQEAALARDWVFLCGENDISPKVIEAAMIVFRDTDARGDMGKIKLHAFLASSIFEMRQQVQKTSKDPGQYPDHELLMSVSLYTTISQRHCQLAEDRIWGLRGLSTSSPLLDHNLQHAPNTDDLYTHFSRHVLSRNTPDRLWWIWLELAFSPVRSPTLPSWVPDFHLVAATSMTYDPIRHHSLEEGVKIRASHKDTKFRLGEYMNEVLLRGKMLDEVMEVLDVLQDNSLLIGSERFQALYLQCRMAAWMDMVDMVDSCLDKRRTTQTSRGLTEKNLRHVDICWRFLFAMKEDSDGENYLRLHCCKIQRDSRVRFCLQGPDCVSSFVTDQRHRLHDNDSDMLESEWMHVTYLQTTIFHTSLSRFQQKQLFFTKGDRFGFTMRGVKPGDSVCVLHGALVPHVLRKVDSLEEGEDRWRFVGDALVHGLMSGEADEMSVDETEFCLV